MADKHLTNVQASRVISRALERYSRGCPSGALDLLNTLDLEPCSVDEMCEGMVPAAAPCWVAIAVDRIKREQGEPISYAITPVSYALQRALHCLEARP